MKHAAIIIVIVVAVYAALQFMIPRESRDFRKAATHQGLRLAALLLVVGLLIAVKEA